MAHCPSPPKAPGAGEEGRGTCKQLLIGQESLPLRKATLRLGAAISSHFPLAYNSQASFNLTPSSSMLNIFGLSFLRNHLVVFLLHQGLANSYPTLETHLKYCFLNKVLPEYPRVYFRFCTLYSSLDIHISHCFSCYYMFK